MIQNHLAQIKAAHERRLHLHKMEALAEIRITRQQEREKEERECDFSFRSKYVRHGNLLLLDCNAGNNWQRSYKKAGLI